MEKWQQSMSLLLILSRMLKIFHFFQRDIINTVIFVQQIEVFWILKLIWNYKKYQAGTSLNIFLLDIVMSGMFWAWKTTIYKYAFPRTLNRKLKESDITYWILDLLKCSFKA